AGAAQRRMVGARQDASAAPGSGGSARPHRDAGGSGRTRGRDGDRLARHSGSGAREHAEGASGQTERTMSAPRHQLADELLRRFAATLRSAQLYSAGHPIITRNLEALSAALQLLHSLQPTTVIGLVADEVIV